MITLADEGKKIVNPTTPPDVIWLTEYKDGSGLSSVWHRDDPSSYCPRTVKYVRADLIPEPEEK
jgi:hypothetical protein